MKLSRPKLAAAFAVALPCLVALVLLSGATAGANPGVAGAPLGIVSASLRQDGQQLVWSVQLAEAFSAARLGRADRSLCLGIEQAGPGATSGELCVIGPSKRSRQARLLFTRNSEIRSGAGRVVPGTVARPSSSALRVSFLPAAIGAGYRRVRWQAISAISPPACSSPIPSGCADVYPAQLEPLSLHHPVLVRCVASGPSLANQGPAGKREIALTFDDGPWGDPPSIDFVQMLAREHVPATFFEIGRQISEFDPRGAVERLMLSDGDMIGDHTWSHPNMATLGPGQQRAQLLDTAAAIRRATGGFTPCLWRPPYGAISRSLVSLARSLGFLTIMWDVDPRDWATPGVGAIYSNVVRNARSGAIVLQHFGGGPRYQTLAAVPKEIETLRARGYTFVTVTQLLGLQLVYR
jgi:peptidoglycan-N-acetylglucosamine deacetylase